jgi:hypothetical protein
VAVNNSTGGNAANARIVVVEVLLGVIVGVSIHRSRARSILNGRDLVARKGTLELGRGGHHVVALGRENAGGGFSAVFRDVLEVERVAEGCGASADAANVVCLVGGRDVDGRHALLGTVTVNIAPATGGSCLGQV